MSKKLFLTSIFVLCAFVPAFADNDYITASSTCDNDTLNSTTSADIAAEWTPLSYDVIYTAGTNGTGSSTETDDITYDDSYTIKSLGGLTSSLSANTGYHFVNYTSSYPSANTSYAPGDTISQYQNTGNLTLTANFAANETTVTYSCGNGVSGSAPASGTATYGQNFVFASLPAQNPCAITGNTFSGWYCSDLGGTQTAGGNGATWTYTGVHGGTVACTAVFTPNRITITWYEDDDAAEPMSVDSEAATCTYGETITLPTQPTRPGYTFAGWVIKTPAAAPAAEPEEEPGE